MSSREARRERRAAERKVQKLARKAEAHAAASPRVQFVSQNTPDMADVPKGRPDEAASQGIQAPRSAFPFSEAETQGTFVSQNETGPARDAQFVSQKPPQSITEPKTKSGPTGPRTPEGKQIASRNSLKHGLASATLVVPGEDPAAYQELLHALIADHQPANPTEQLLVEQMAQSHWLSQRALRLQEQCFGEDGVDEKRLALFLRYFTTHQRAFHKALNTLMRLKKDKLPAERKFVSHKPPAAAPHPHFVSQNGRQNAEPSPVRFVIPPVSPALADKTFRYRE